jgi:site-specific recombinase XerD
VAHDIHEHLGRWWWLVSGKGNKTQRVPLNTQAISVLSRYRSYYALTPLPEPDEDNALFMSIKGRSSVSSNMIYRIVKKVFLDCAQSIEDEKPNIAKKLTAASTHWLRHTSITHQSDVGIELRYIKRSARHENIQTTMLYQHAEDHLWHEAMEKHKLNVATTKEADNA